MLSLQNKTQNINLMYICRQTLRFCVMHHWFLKAVLIFPHKMHYFWGQKNVKHADITKENMFLVWEDSKQQILSPTVTVRAVLKKIGHECY